MTQLITSYPQLESPTKSTPSHADREKEHLKVDISSDGEKCNDTAAVNDQTPKTEE